MTAMLSEFEFDCAAAVIEQHVPGTHVSEGDVSFDPVLARVLQENAPADGLFAAAELVDRPDATLPEVTGHLFNAGVCDAGNLFMQVDRLKGQFDAEGMNRFPDNQVREGAALVYLVAQNPQLVANMQLRSRR